MSTHDGDAQVPGSQPMPGSPPTPGAPTDAELARMDQAELVRLGGSMDGVQVLHSELPFEPGSAGERRAERQVAAAFGGAGLAALAFVVIFVAWPWQTGELVPAGEFDWAALYTPLLGLTMGVALTLVGVGVVLWAKKLMPYEVTVQERHEGASPEVERQTTAATLMTGLASTGIARRTAIKRSLGFGGAMLGLMAVVAPLGGFIKKPKGELDETPWTEGMRLLRNDGSPIKPGDMRPGSLETVFPAVEGGNRAADAATMLIRLRAEQVEAYQPREGQEGHRWNDFVAYSKICTHAGCPVSLYEQQTGLILCPCHQSQFDVTRGARSIFGPATRSLPQLAINVDDEGYFVAQGDFDEPVGPAFWERST